MLSGDAKSVFRSPVESATLMALNSKRPGDGSTNMISPSARYDGNAACSSTIVGTPPVTGIVHASHSVDSVGSWGTWKMTLLPSGLKFGAMNHHQPAMC